MSHWGASQNQGYIRRVGDYFSLPPIVLRGLLSGVSWVIDAGMVLLKDDIYMKGSDSEKNKTPRNKSEPNADISCLYTMYI